MNARLVEALAATVAVAMAAGCTPPAVVVEGDSGAAGAGASPGAGGGAPAAGGGDDGGVGGGEAAGGEGAGGTGGDGDLGPYGSGLPRSALATYDGCPYQASQDAQCQACIERECLDPLLACAVEEGRPRDCACPPVGGPGSGEINCLLDCMAGVTARAENQALCEEQCKGMVLSLPGEQFMDCMFMPVLSGRMPVPLCPACHGMKGSDGTGAADSPG